MLAAMRASLQSLSSNHVAYLLLQTVHTRGRLCPSQLEAYAQSLWTAVDLHGSTFSFSPFAVPCVSQTCICGRSTVFLFRVYVVIYPTPFFSLSRVSGSIVQ